VKKGPRRIRPDAVRRAQGPDRQRRGDDCL